MDPEFGKVVNPFHIETIIELALVNDTHINVHATQIIANITSEAQQIPKINIYLSKILEISNFTQIRYDWESAFSSLIPNNENQEIIENQTSEINFQFIRILANFLTLSSKKKENEKFI